MALIITRFDAYADGERQWRDYRNTIEYGGAAVYNLLDPTNVVARDDEDQIISFTSNYLETNSLMSSYNGYLRAYLVKLYPNFDFLGAYINRFVIEFVLTPNMFEGFEWASYGLLLTPRIGEESFIIYSDSLNIIPSNDPYTIVYEFYSHNPAPESYTGFGEHSVIQLDVYEPQA